MKKLLAIFIVLFASVSFAQVTVKNITLFADQLSTSTEVATLMDAKEGVYHAPQYMPMYPTSAVIWARVIEVPCTQTSTGLLCEGYTWHPGLGRAEYLFIKPVIPAPLVPTVIIKEVPVVVIREVTSKKK